MNEYQKNFFVLITYITFPIRPQNTRVTPSPLHNLSLKRVAIKKRNPSQKMIKSLNMNHVYYFCVAK